MKGIGIIPRAPLDELVIRQLNQLACAGVAVRRMKRGELAGAGASL